MADFGVVAPEGVLARAKLAAQISATTTAKWVTDVAADKALGIDHIDDRRGTPRQVDGLLHRPAEVLLECRGRDEEIVVNTGRTRRLASGHGEIGILATGAKQQLLFRPEVCWAVLMVDYGFDTSALSALRRQGLESAQLRQLATRLGLRNERILIPRFAISELIRGGGSTPQEAFEMIKYLVRVSDGRVVLGRSSLHDLWREEVWSSFAVLGQDGVEVEKILSGWISSVDGLREDVGAFFQLAKLKFAELQRPAKALHARLDPSAISWDAGADLLHPPDDLVRTMAAHVLAQIGVKTDVSRVVRNQFCYRSIVSVAVLDAFNRQTMLVPANLHTKFQEDLRPLLKEDPNHEVDAMIVSACAYSRLFVSNDRTLNARLSFLRSRGFPVPAPMALDAFLNQAN